MPWSWGLRFGLGCSVHRGCSSLFIARHSWSLRCVACSLLLSLSPTWVYFLGVEENNGHQIGSESPTFSQRWTVCSPAALCNRKSLIPLIKLFTRCRSAQETRVSSEVAVTQWHTSWVVTDSHLHLQTIAAGAVKVQRTTYSDRWPLPEQLPHY